MASTTPPKLIFIVPYRDREQQRQFFARHMEHILSDYAPGEAVVYFVHQRDGRSFNRGAIKNIGFIAMRAKFPETYQTTTFVFNDVDTMPYTKGFLNYETTPGIVKHFYGFQFALGGIVSIRGADFERINGFPNFWAWGYEDNLFQSRVLRASPPLHIDRSQFYPLMDKNIMQMKDGLERCVNKKEFDRYLHRTPEGIQSIRDLRYCIEDDFVQVDGFETGVEEDRAATWSHDLRKGSHPFGKNHQFYDSNVPSKPSMPKKFDMVLTNVTRAVR